MKTQREIKFRAWCNINKCFLKDFEYPNGHSGLFLRILTGEMVDIQLTGNEDGYSDISYDFFNPEFYDIELQQFTGLKDKNGTDIYEGDIIRYRQAFRSYDIQYGDAMPNNRCAFPMEPEIRTHEYPVIFNECAFGCNTISYHEDYQNTDFTPLNWLERCYETENDVKEAVSFGRNSDDFWSLPETKEGDLEYLLETYKLNDVPELLNYLSGIEVIGNIYEN